LVAAFSKPLFNPVMSDKILNQTFGALVLLTGLTALLSRFTEGGSALMIAGILTLTVGKVFLVAFQFMELKHAHKAWRAVFVALIAAIALTIFLLV
jgi:uncharacterized membrane protein HdeD (DUF308 family)